MASSTLVFPPNLSRNLFRWLQLMRSIDFVQSLNSAAFMVHTSISSVRYTFDLLIQQLIVTEPKIKLLSLVILRTQKLEMR